MILLVGTQVAVGSSKHGLWQTHALHASREVANRCSTVIRHGTLGGKRDAVTRRSETCGLSDSHRDEYLLFNAIDTFSLASFAHLERTP